MPCLRCFSWPLALLAVTVGLLLAATASAAPGDLTQLADPNECISEAGGDCVDGVGLDTARSVAVSPDGKSVYTASAISNAVAAFARELLPAPVPAPAPPPAPGASPLATSTQTPSPPGTCRGRTATHTGTVGDDTIVATSGPDIIQAGPGDDVIRSLAGGDLVCAGPGADVVDAGPGADTVFADAGDDLDGGAGPSDRGNGGDGDDSCVGLETTLSC